MKVCLQPCRKTWRSNCLLFAMFAHLLLAGAAFSAGVSGLQAQAHQHRPSLNFGSDTSRRVTASILNDADVDATALLAFNDANSFKASSSSASGASIAQAFLQQLHPQQQFRLQSSVKSAQDSVYHAYYVSD